MSTSLRSQLVYGAFGPYVDHVCVEYVQCVAYISRYYVGAPVLLYLISGVGAGSV